MGMTLYGGEVVSLDSGVPELFTMGVSLGRVVRFTGHLRQFYSVLAHSITVAGIMPEEYAIYGLMHDTQECIFSDVPTPVKSQVARNREHRVQSRIYPVYGLQWPVPEEIQEAVEEADHTALQAEAVALGHRAGGTYWGTDVDPIALKLTKQQAKFPKVLNYLDADYAGKLFENTFNKYAKLAGINAPDWS